jgi:hypothetical protein
MSNEMPQMNSFENSENEEIKLSPENQAIFDECVAGVDNEIIINKAAEIGPEGVREILKKATKYVGGNIRAFSLLGFTALSVYAGSDGVEKPADWMSQEQFSHGWAIVAADKGGNIKEDNTVKLLRREGYTDAQISKLMPGTQVAAEQQDSTVMPRVASAE